VQKCYVRYYIVLLIVLNDKFAAGLVGYLPHVSQRRSLQCRQCPLSAVVLQDSLWVVVALVGAFFWEVVHNKVIEQRI